MSLRYEIIDREHPQWTGMRFSTLASAERELARSVPAGRFYIREMEAYSTAKEEALVHDEIRELLVSKLTPASRRNVVIAVAHGFGFEIEDDALHKAVRVAEAAKELGVDI